MKPFAAAFRAIVIAVVLASSARLASAARADGTLLDESARAHAPASPAHLVPAPAAHAAPCCDDDAPTLRSTAAPRCSTLVHIDAARAASRPSLPATPDHRGEKRERGRATTSGTAQVHRPQAQRLKGQVRNTPATPGMGLLLRFGTNAGREISMNVDDLCHAPTSSRSGRAPPRAGPSSNLALASSPRAQHLAPHARALRPESLEGVQPSPTDDTSNPDRPAPSSARPATASAPIERAAHDDASPDIQTERLPGSRAVRSKGASACLTPPPFGGFIA